VTRIRREPGFLRAALKVVYDDTTDEDRAYLYLPGQILVARNTKTQRAASSIQAGTSRAPALYLDPNTWEWDQQRSGAVQHGRMPVSGSPTRTRWVNLSRIWTRWTGSIIRFCRPW
jgi:hypothetical protein